MFPIFYSTEIQKIPLLGKSSVHEVDDLTSKTMIKEEKEPQNIVLIWYFNLIW